MRLLTMPPVEVFGTLAVTSMLTCYALEARGSHCVIGFAGACLASVVYAVLIRAWPFAIVESIWAIAAMQRWQRLR